MDAAEDVTEVNRRYYEAFEAGDLDAMSALWERSARVTCTHPGWPTLRGWGQIASSFYALFEGGADIQYVLTRTEVVTIGDVSWVSLDENLLGDQGGITVATVNIFARDGGAEPWRMVCHHGSVVQAALG